MANAARAFVALSSFCIAVAACSDSGSQAVGPAVRDSAGVRVVTFEAFTADPFSLGDDVRFTPGTSDEAGLPLFRVVGGRILGDGSIIVADAGNYRVLRWSPTGERIGSFGAQGDGPGEFQSMAWMHASEGELAFYDSRTRRVSWFTSDGEFLRSSTFAVERPEPPTPDAIWTGGLPLGVVSRDRLLGYAMAFADPAGQPGPLPLVADLAVYDLSDELLRTAGRFMLMEWYESVGERPTANRLGTPRGHWYGQDDLFVIAHPVSARLDVLVDGALSAVILEDVARYPFEPDSIPSEYELAVDSLQAYRDVRVDGLRRIWVQPDVPEGEPTIGWRVFSETGDRLGDLELPADATVLDADDESILLLRRSEFDEESLAVWDLRGPGR